MLNNSNAHRATLSNALLRPPASVPLDCAWADDDFGIRYRFDVYSIRDRPIGVNAVYWFAFKTAYSYVPLYIGRAEMLSDRLPGHERLPEAIRRGATHLLVHVPGAHDLVKFAEVEKRLIQCFSPPMNTQHNTLLRY